MLQEGKGSIPCQARRRRVECIQPVRFEEPVASAAVMMKGHRAACAPQGFLPFSPHQA